MDFAEQPRKKGLCYTTVLLYLLHAEVVRVHLYRFQKTQRGIPGGGAHDVLVYVVIVRIDGGIGKEGLLREETRVKPKPASITSSVLVLWR